MLAVYSLEQAEEWDAVVRSFREYDVFYLSDYCRAFMRENLGYGTPILLLYKNNQDRAVNVVFQRDVALDRHFEGILEKGMYFDLITPYGYGGFRGTVSDWKKLNREYGQFCTDNGYICEFVRFELFSDYYLHYDGVVETRTHNVVRSLELSQDELWMDFRQKVRKNVKKAANCGVKIIAENTGAFFDDFLRIYYATMDRAGADQSFYFSKPFFENLNRMKDHVMYFHAVSDEKIISTELVIYGSGNAYSYLGGTDHAYFDVRPNDFLKYEIIKWCRNKGLRNFVLGGGYGTDDGIFEYKKCFAPEGVVDFYIGHRIFDEEKYQYLCDVRKVEDTQYFPAYRSKGKQG